MKKMQRIERQKKHNIERIVPKKERKQNKIWERYNGEKEGKLNKRLEGE